MARSNRTGVSRPVPKAAPAPTRPSIPASTQPRPGAAVPPANTHAAPHSTPHHATPHHAPPPPPAMAPPAAAPPAMGGGGGGMMSGIMGSVVQGMAMGTGSAIASRAVDSIMGPRTVQMEHVHSGAPAEANQGAPASGNVCFNENTAFQDCAKSNNGETAACQYYMDMLNACKNKFA